MKVNLNRIRSYEETVVTVYLIAQITINDRDEYAKYEQGFMDIFNKYEGQLLSVDENPLKLEGEWSATRSVLVSFPSKEAAMAWYESDEYQALVQHRFASSTGNIIVATGLDEL